MTAHPIIALRAIAKLYGEGEATVTALHETDLEIARGEHVAIMGPSGSGKSTLLNILGCLDTPSAGSYLFDGYPVERLARRERALLRRYAFGFVFQGFNLLPRTSALDNVELPLIYRGDPPRHRRAAALAALESVGLVDRAGHTPAELSGGQQQRVAIARALVTEPQLLLADEPTGNLDSERSEDVMRLLAELSSTRRITVVVITHETDMAAFADRTIVFRDGRMQGTMTSGEAAA